MSHRLHLAQTAISQGYDVTLLTNVDAHKTLIEENGINVISWSLRRNSLNPLKEIQSILQVIKTIQLIKPSLIHSVALKPILYSAIASMITSVKCRVFAFAGLGYVFTSHKLLARLFRIPISLSIRFLLKNDYSSIILQNQDDVSILLNLNIIKKDSVELIPGSGVDINLFFPQKIQNEHSIPIVMLPARLLWDKGIGDFVLAAKILKDRDIKARFVLVGQPDLHNPASISDGQISEWVDSEIIEYWGFKKNMSEILNQSTIICLPSYREGFPKVLLEAASCGKPIVTTDVPGCRQAIQNNISGFLVPPNNPKALSRALEKLILDQSLCKKMGKEGLKRVRLELSQEIIAKQTISLWERILARYY